MSDRDVGTLLIGEAPIVLRRGPWSLTWDDVPLRFAGEIRHRGTYEGVDRFTGPTPAELFWLEHLLRAGPIRGADGQVIPVAYRANGAASLHIVGTVRVDLAARLLTVDLTSTCITCWDD